ncbi:hypothetical protein GCK72_022606 [Caenorhabditis remanei]|uniref:C2H2-type domain-containing protein n=1 Tax=Caenorhabditis remanei TaxID=31234 RepID=A0A6A5FUD2_CAERE|nr:hypothetical protein GCK72_022606 [Caenorhabditis remanei]KAF1746153.1 hypothetical protein GCK72_022606 [Caenorhabditis remanei]
MSRTSRFVAACKNCSVCNALDTRGVNRRANAKKRKKCAKVAKAAKGNTCKDCNASFATKQSLKAHIKLHDPNRETFPCDKCSKIFNTRGNLKYHYKQYFKSKQEFNAAWIKLNNRVPRQALRPKNTVATSSQGINVDDRSGEDSDDQESVSGTEENEDEFKEDADDIEMEIATVELNDGEDEDQFEDEDNNDVNGNVDMDRFQDIDGNYIDEFPPPEDITHQDRNIEELHYSDMEYIGEDNDTVEVPMRIEYEENDQNHNEGVPQDIEFEQETLHPVHSLEFTEVSTVTWFPRETEAQVPHTSNKTGFENLKALCLLMKEDRRLRNMDIETTRREQSASAIDQMVEKSTSRLVSSISNLFPPEMKAECSEVCRKIRGYFQQSSSDFMELFENFMKKMISNDVNMESIQFVEQLEEKCRIHSPRKRGAEIIHMYKKVALRRSGSFKEIIETAYMPTLNSTMCHCGLEVYNKKVVTPQGLYFVILLDAWSPTHRIVDLTSNSFVDMFGSKWRVHSFVERIPHPMNTTEESVYVTWNQTPRKWTSIDVKFVAPMEKQTIFFKEHEVKALVFKKVRVEF